MAEYGGDVEAPGALDVHEEASTRNRHRARNQREARWEELVQEHVSGLRKTDVQSRIGSPTVGHRGGAGGIIRVYCYIDIIRYAQQW